MFEELLLLYFFILEILLTYFTFDSCISFGKSIRTGPGLPEEAISKDL